MFEIEYELREEDLVQFNEMRLKNNSDIQATLRKNSMFVPAVMMFIAMFYYFYYDDMPTTIYVTVLAVGWGIVSPYIIKMDMRRQILEGYKKEEREAILGEHKLVIEQDDLLDKAPGGKHRMPWEDMVRVEYVKNYVHIYTDLDSAIIIPVKTLIKGDLEKFADQADKMIERLS
ncbi:MAG: YcxB family protein [Methylococcaceae bacterium]|nr:YcxB family protein [Methylococcaceae bacterium]